VEDLELQKEILYYVGVLSEDNKFISAVQEIYLKRHKGFESGL